MENEDTFSEKKLKKLPTGFKEDADTLDVEGLKKEIIASENNLYQINKEKDNDEKLNAAKELVKDYSSGYREATVAQKAKIEYCCYLLRAKGVVVKDE